MDHLAWVQLSVPFTDTCLNATNTSIVIVEQTQHQTLGCSLKRELSHHSRWSVDPPEAVYYLVKPQPN